MDKISKFLRTLQPKLRHSIAIIVLNIVQNKLTELDIKPIKGRKNIFRCRSGNIRIIFMKNTSTKNTVISIQFRGKAYKNL